MPRQFHIRTLLIAIAICAFGTWWVIRPRQTAEWFVTEGYKSISPDDNNWELTSFRQMLERDPSKVVITPEKRWSFWLCRGCRSAKPIRGTSPPSPLGFVALCQSREA